MRNAILPNNRAPSGMTLIESSLVMLLLLSLVSVVFTMSKGWRREADRTLCIINQHQVQVAVRGYANLYGMGAGEEVPGLAEMVFGDGRFIDRTPLCPSSGLYSFGGERIPLRGELYMKCSLAVEGGHLPEDSSTW